MDFYGISNFAQAPAGPGGGSQLLVLGLLFVGMWFLIIAPQRKKQKQHARMLESLKTGDSVLTNGGIYGIIANIKNDRFVLKIADNTKIELHKSFVQSVVSEEASK
jgi:preprotein translocase subunit YajC